MKRQGRPIFALSAALANVDILDTTLARAFCAHYKIPMTASITRNYPTTPIRLLATSNYNHCMAVAAILRAVYPNWVHARHDINALTASTYYEFDHLVSHNNLPEIFRRAPQSTVIALGAAARLGADNETLTTMLKP